MPRKAGLTNSAILESLVDLEKGLSIADLGKNLYKVRVKREGQAKSSGFRTIVVFRKGRTYVLDQTQLTVFDYNAAGIILRTEYGLCRI